MDLLLEQTLAWGLRASNKTMANSLRMTFQMKWMLSHQSYKLGGWNWAWIFPFLPQKLFIPERNSKSTGTAGRPSWKSELVSEVTQSTCILDKSLVCCYRHIKGCPRFKQHILFLLSLSSEFLFKKLLNVSGLYIFSTWQELLLSGC